MPRQIQIENDDARLRFSREGPLLLDKLERLLTIPKQLQFIFFFMVIQGETKQKHVRRIVFYDEDPSRMRAHSCFRRIR